MTFPKSLRPSERGRDMWLMISIGTINGREPPDGTDKLLQILDAVFPDSVIMSEDKDGDGAGEGRIYVIGCGQKARDESRKDY